MVRRPKPSPEPVTVLDDPARVGAVLSPLRRTLLDHLSRAPDSAAGLARRLALPRQRLNYHLRELERAGFLELHEERQRRGCIERTLRVAARTYVIDPELLGRLAADPAAIRDRFSSGYLVALAGRLVGDVSALRRGAERAGKPLPTLALETEVRFASAESRAAFAEELAGALARLAAKYHDDSPRARAFRFVLAGHPAPKREAAAQDAPRSAPSRGSEP